MGGKGWTSSSDWAWRQYGIKAGFVLRPLHFLIFLISGLLPRDSNWWIFGSWSGLRVADSPLALIQHIDSHHPEVKTTWITAKKSIAVEMRRQGFDSRSRWSPRGIWASMRGGTFIYDGLTKDINHWLSRGATTVNLRHGIGPKRIERSIDTESHRLYKLFHGTPLERVWWSILLPWHRVRPDVVIASSEAHAEIGALAFGVPPESVAITGLPRHDVLFDRSSRRFVSADEKRAIDLLEGSDKPAFLYMPTFRDLDDGPGTNWTALDRAADEVGVNIHVKLHLVDADRQSTTKAKVDKCAGLVWVSPNVDPMMLYPHAIGLITDFSSVALDMMLLRKPIIYYIPDFERFTAGRSLYFPFDQMSPGPKCETPDELSKAMARFRNGELGEYEEHYDEVVELFYKFKDGSNSCRVFDAISTFLQS